MSRIRSVHPDICQSEPMSTISASGERTFVRLWTHCDDQGRCIDNPRLIKAALYPLHDDMTAETVDADLTELERAGLLVRYEAEGKRCLVVVSFPEYQKPKYPTKSKLPEPPEASPSPSPGLPQSFPEPLHGEGVGVGVVEGEGVGVRRVSVERRPEAIRLAVLLEDQVRHNGAKTPTDLSAWTKELDLLIRVDGADPTEVEHIIRWATEDTFWKGNILSAGKLRKQYDQLKIKHNGRTPNNGAALANASETFLARHA